MTFFYVLSQKNPQEIRNVFRNWNFGFKSYNYQEILMSVIGGYVKKCMINWERYNLRVSYKCALSLRLLSQNSFMFRKRIFIL